MKNPVDARCGLLMGGLLLALSVTACGADTESLDARRCSVDEDCASGMCDEGVCAVGGDNNPANNNPANNNPANNNPSNNSTINNNPSNNNPVNNNPSNNSTVNNNPANNNPANNSPANNNPVACVEDALSPNHSYAEAYALSPADALGELTLCEASPDFFALGLGLAEQATVEVTVDDVDAAVELAVYNPGNLELAAPDQVIPADDGLITAVFGAGGEGTFYVVVRGASAEARHAYGLGVSVETLCEPAEEICDGLDNDCDGEEDEGCDDDDDGVCDAGMTLVEGGAPTCPQGGGDCDDDDAHRFPGNAEVCSGQLPDGRAAAAHDEDCDPCTVAGGLGDGDVDGDDYPAASCVNDWVGAEAPTTCALTTTRLDEVNRRVVGADCRDAAADGASFNPDRVESCNMQDDDCDGEVDEGPDGSPLACDCTTPGEERVCGTDTGACTQGTQTCLANGTWTACSGVMPAVEVCDAARVDEDCDGEANPAALCACDGNEEELCEHLQGVCAGGTRRCNGQGQWGACSIAPSTEVCDAAERDEDCDGRENEGCDCIPGVTPPTTSGCEQRGACSGSTRSCQTNGRWGTCSILPRAEVCGGGDADCDGISSDAELGSFWFFDQDGDGFRPTTTSSNYRVKCCSQPVGYLPESANIDCADDNEHVRLSNPPSAPPYLNGYCYQSNFLINFRSDQACGGSNPATKTTYLDCPNGHKGQSESTVKLSGGGSWSRTFTSNSTNSRDNAYVRLSQTCSGLEGSSVLMMFVCVQDSYTYPSPPSGNVCP